MRKYTYENKEMLYAKGLFYRSLSDYVDATPMGRKQMIGEIKEKLSHRIGYGINDCYTIASKWFIRLEDYLNKKI